MAEKRPEDEAGISPSDDASAASSAEIDLKTDRALMRKLDRNIVPFIVVMYLFSFLDRGWFARLRIHLAIGLCANHPALL